MSCENIGQGEEIKYKASVELKLININNGMIVGRAFAICSSLENGKRNYAEFAITSTAMTRATGKAYGLPLGWLMSAAGYNPCPAEEMDSVVDTNEQAVKPKKEPIRPTQAKAEEQPEPDKMATVKQKQELLFLLNHESVSKEEKDRGIESINKLTEEKAAEAINKLKH